MSRKVGEFSTIHLKYFVILVLNLCSDGVIVFCFYMTLLLKLIRRVVVVIGGQNSPKNFTDITLHLVVIFNQ